MIKTALMIAGAYIVLDTAWALFQAFVLDKNVEE